MKLEYYSAKDIAAKLGCCLSKAYVYIDKLNKTLKKEYPNLVIIEHKIPIWYWEQKTKPVMDMEVQDEN